MSPRVASAFRGGPPPELLHPASFPSLILLIRKRCRSSRDLHFAILKSTARFSRQNQITLSLCDPILRRALFQHLISVIDGLFLISLIGKRLVRRALKA